MYKVPDCAFIDKSLIFSIAHDSPSFKLVFASRRESKKM